MEPDRAKTGDKRYYHIFRPSLKSTPTTAAPRRLLGKLRDSDALCPPRAIHLPQRLAKADEIAERVDHARFDRPPRRRLEARTHVAIVFRADLALKGFDALHHDADARAGRAVAVMLAQMDKEVAARDLAVERHVGLEAMIP